MWECCVPGCSSGKESQSNVWKGKVTMYAFPRTLQDRKKWLDAIGGKINMYRIGKAKVCSLHFLPKDLVNIHQVRTPMLRQGALPKVFVDGPPEAEIWENNRPKQEWNVQDRDGDVTEVPYCVVKGCHNDVMDLAAGVAFFRFPKARGQIEQWAGTLGHPADWRPPPLARLCSQHFDPLLSMGGSSKDSKPPDQAVQDLSTLTEDHIKLVHPRQTCDFWKTIKDYYDQGLYCDLRIVCLSEDYSVEETKLEDIYCHRLVLASMSSMIAAAALSSSNDEDSVLYALDYDKATVKQAIDTLYACLAQERDMEELTNGEVGQILSDLGVDWKSFKIMQSERRRIRFEHNYNQDDYILDDAWPHDADYDISGASEIEDSDWIKEEIDGGDSEEEADVNLEKEEKAKPIKRKAKTGRKPALSKRRKLSQEGLDTFHDKFVNEEGTISVDLVPELFNAKGYSTRYHYDMMVVLGLRQTENGPCQFDALPLALSPKVGEQVTAEEIMQYYDRFRFATKAVFGLSRVEVTGAAVCYRMGLCRSGTNTFAKKKYEYKRVYVNHTKEELENLLTEVVVSANKTGPIKSKFYEGLVDGNKGLAISGVELRLNLISDVSSYDDLDGIIVVTYKESGGVLAHALSVNEDSREKDVSDLMKVFFDTFTIHEWTGTPRQITVPKVDSLVEEAKENAKLQALYCVVQDLLKGDREAIKEKLSGLGHKVCDTCGQEFMVESMNDMNNYRQHRRRHFFENYNCECGIEFQSTEERRSHVQLVHLKGYTLCSHCTFVGNKRFMREHVKDRHEEFTCKECGKTIEGKYNLNIHLESSCETVVFDSDDMKGNKYYPSKVMHFYESYKCNCNIEFKDLGEKKNHVQLIHMKGYTECPDCNRIVRHALLPDHFKRLHKEISCENCGVNLKGTTAYNNHMRIEHDVKVAEQGMTSVRRPNMNSRYVSLSTFHPHPDTSEVPHKTEPCVDCGRTFDSPRQLYVHWTDCHRESKCLECDVSFVGDCKRKVHTKKYHMERKDRDAELATCICQRCGKILADVDSLRRHLKLMHGSSGPQDESGNEANQPVDCPECGKTLAQADSLRKHRKAMHGYCPEKEKRSKEQVHKGPVICEECGKTLAHEDSLRKHIKNIHGSGRPEEEKKVYLCEECNMTFTKLGSLTRHRRTLHGIGEGCMCSDCGKTYNTHEQLKAHIACMHKEMTCDTCGVKVSGWQGRNIHNKNFHPTEKDIKVNCPDCGKTLANDRQLQAHRYSKHIPESEWPVPCPQCDRRFANHSRLWAHKNRAHSTTRRFVCRYDGCTNDYKEQSDRIGHEIKKHGMSFSKYQKTLLGEAT